MTKRQRDQNKLAITSATTTVSAYDHLYAPSAVTPAKAIEFSVCFSKRTSCRSGFCFYFDKCETDNCGSRKTFSFGRIDKAHLQSRLLPQQCHVYHHVGGEDSHPWSAKKVGNPTPATIPVDQ